MANAYDTSGGGDDTCGSRMDRRVPLDDLSLEYVQSRLAYDPETGVFTWKRKPELNRLDKAWNSRYAGRIAGSKCPHHKTTYIQIRIDHVAYCAHRLAWLTMTGTWPVRQIDHIDLNGSNNQFANLRLATNSENKCNGTRYGNNASGYRGVSLNGGRWRAVIHKDKKQYHLGYYPTPEEAGGAYYQATIKLHGEFAASKRLVHNGR